MGFGTNVPSLDRGFFFSPVGDDVNDGTSGPNREEQSSHR